MSAPIEVQSVKQWNESLRNATSTGRTVIVDCHAQWCGPCKTMAPVFAKLAKDYPQSVFLRVDVDNQKAIAAKYQITAMPTFFAIKSGSVVDTLKGADRQGLTRLASTHSGPNPPVAPLPEGAEKAKTEGNAFFKDGKWEDAIAKYSEAIEIAPTSAALHANRSLTHLKSSSPQLALADAQQASTLEPLWAKGWVRLGDALEATDGEGKDVVAAFEKAVDLAKEGTVRKEAREKLDKVKAKLGWH